MKPQPRTMDFPITGEYLLSIKGVAAKLQMSERTVRELVRLGTLPQPLPSIGALVRWRGRDIDQWILELSRSLKASA